MDNAISFKIHGIEFRVWHGAEGWWASSEGWRPGPMRRRAAAIGACRYFADPDFQYVEPLIFTRPDGTEIPLCTRCDDSPAMHGGWCDSCMSG